MNLESWQRLKDLYAAALQLPVEERERFIQEAAKDDEYVRNEALAMLRVTMADPHFLEQDSAPLAKGQVITERFRIEEFISRGGMGKVYRATDLELNRTVALKTVRSRPFIEEHLRVRIRQEAQLISKLNHPAICTLYDVRSDRGVDYLIMEFLEGESLALRLSHGPIPLPQCIQIAVELLGALDYAHRQGVIHRDIKPGNVMLTKSGAKLLDFGIAKYRDYNKLVDESQIAHTPVGLVHGTPPFMAPEQFRDGTADVRSDIYSFGIMFGNMLSPRKYAPGATALNLAELQPPFRQIVEKCLLENPSERWQDAGDLKTAVELASQPPLEYDSIEQSRKRLKRVASVLAAVAIVSVVVAILFWGPPPVPQRLEFQMFPPGGSQFVSIERAGPPVISPDGASLAFVARDETGQEKLWLRRLDTLAAVPLTGTEGASHPFWSPDSRSIGFFSRNRLMALELGGAPRLISEARDGRGATWSRDGVIVFSTGYTDPLSRVSAAGGVPVQITSLRTDELENSHRWPSFLPDGKHVLFVLRTFNREQSGLHVVSIDGGRAKRIPGVDSSAVYVSQNDGRGYLLYARGSQIIAQEFLLDKLELAGEPIAVAELGWTDTTTTRSPVSVSDTGVLAFGGGQSSNSQLIWNDGKGKELARLRVDGTTRFLRLSPDLRTVALERLDFRYGSGSLWLFESEREMSTRFTFEPTSAYSPVWSPDGRSIAFTMHKGRGFDFMWKSVDGASSMMLKSSSQAEPLIPTDWTSDDWILYEIQNPKTGWDIFAVSAQRPEMQRILLNSSADERQARVSPNGQWLAYNSNESGSEQIYVQPFLKPGTRFAVSASGGSQPIWHQDSTNVFFLDGSRTLVRTRLDFQKQRAGTPETLFHFAPASERGMMAGWEYDIAPDGTRFLTGLAASLLESKPLTVVHGWKLRP